MNSIKVNKLHNRLIISNTIMIKYSINIKINLLILIKISKFNFIKYKNDKINIKNKSKDMNHKIQINTKHKRKNILNNSKLLFKIKLKVNKFKINKMSQNFFLVV